MNDIENLLFSTKPLEDDTDEYADILLHVQKSIVANNIKDLNNYLMQRTQYTEDVLKKHIGNIDKKLEDWYSSWSK